MYASMALIGALKDSGLINEQIGYQAQLLRNASDLNGTAVRKRAQERSRLPKIVSRCVTSTSIFTIHDHFDGIRMLRSSLPDQVYFKQDRVQERADGHRAPFERFPCCRQVQP